MNTNLAPNNYDRIKKNHEEWDKNSKTHSPTAREKNGRLLYRLITDVSRVSNADLIKFLFSKNLHISAQLGKGFAVDKEITKGFASFRYCSSMAEFLQKFGSDRRSSHVPANRKYFEEEAMCMSMASLQISPLPIELYPELPDEILFPKINELVEKHLEPYLDGTITAQTEDKNRSPLTQILIQQLKKNYPRNSFDENKVREIALSAYFYFSASKFNSVNQCLVNPRKNEHYLKVDRYLRALNHSVGIDFSDCNGIDIDSLGKKILELIYDDEKKTRTHRQK